MMVKSTVSVE